MPKAASRTSGPTPATNRTEPYPKPSFTNTTDKENVDPNAKISKPSKQPAQPDHHLGDYRATPLPEVKGEVPCYDDAATVRRRLKKLLTEKTLIPGTGKKWSQASMTDEMQELEKREGAVGYNRNAMNGPTARSLGGFMKKTGQMGGGDSPCYYWGYVMLEKLRVWNGEKKSKPRARAEEELVVPSVRLILRYCMARWPGFRKSPRARLAGVPKLSAMKLARLDACRCSSTMLHHPEDEGLKPAVSVARCCY